MRSFYKIFAALLAAILLLFIGTNVFLFAADGGRNKRPWQVEIGRLALEIENSGLENISLSSRDYVKHVEKQKGDNADFYCVDSDYAIREINGEKYRFDYVTEDDNQNTRLAMTVNIVLAVMALLTVGVLVYVRQKILVPFEKLADVPLELAKGNLTVPMKESKNRFFGRFTWGVNLLRENMEQQKQRELDLHRSRKTLLLSLSHDIKTPLSAIKLYAKALSKELYSDREKQHEIAESINEKADEIEGFVAQIINASREDFLNLEVDMGEFYLSVLMGNIANYYREKLALVKTHFSMGEYSNCLIKGDVDRGIEILQNIMENAIKYGDGKSVGISICQEEDCVLVEVKNSGCTLPETELPHVFDSFWRGSNSQKAKGSGLGLYICRQLINKMGGEIFAQIRDGYMAVTVVFCKA